MIETTSLWCVHILGPDDVIAYPDRQSAEREAAVINDAMAKLIVSRPADDNWPMLKAIAAIWPHSPESHAQDLARNIREMECSGNA